MNNKWTETHGRTIKNPKINASWIAEKSLRLLKKGQKLLCIAFYKNIRRARPKIDGQNGITAI
jgi:hypothetical protein